MDPFCRSLSFVIHSYWEAIIALNTQFLRASVLSKTGLPVLLRSSSFLVPSYNLACGYWEKLLAEGHPFKLYIILCNSNLLFILIISSPTNSFAPTKLAMKNIIFLITKKMLHGLYSKSWSLKDLLLISFSQILLWQREFGSNWLLILPKIILKSISQPEFCRGFCLQS